MTRLAIIFSLLFATNAASETIKVLGKEYQVRERLSCAILSDIKVSMDDFGLTSLETSKAFLERKTPLTVNYLDTGDLIIGLDRYKRQTGSIDRLEGFFNWGSLMQAEIKKTDKGLLMFLNGRDASWAGGTYSIWTEHQWFRCSK